MLIRVTLPDGTQQTVLVPQVYAKVKAGNLTGDGALPGGGSVAFNAQKDITNSGTIDGREVTQLTGQTLTNSGYIDGNQVSLTARQDISNTGGTLRGDSQLTLQAEATRSGNSYKAGKKQEINEHIRQQGTEIASGGDTSLLAGRDLNSAATQVTAQQDITAAAGNNVTLTTATESDYFYKEETKTKKSFLKKKTTHTIEEDSATRESGTLLSGNNVSVAAGSDLLVKGSQVVGDGSVVLNAGNDLNIEAATNTDSSWHFKETKKSGLMGTGGIGFTIGSSKSVQDRREKGITQSQSVSTVGSTSGDVSLTSGGQVKILGADLVAAKNLAINGDAVIIEPGRDRRTSDFKSEQKTSGLSLALSGAVGEAVNSAVATAQTAKNESDGRLVALQATKTALSGVQAALTAQQSQASGEPANMVGVSISLSTQKSKSYQHQASDTVNGTTLNAGKDLSVIATGRGGSVHSGDILIGGSQMKAAGDSTLTAARDILLTGAASSQQTSGNNSSSGGGVGVSIGAGNGGANMSVFANVNGAKGKEQGDGIRWSETTLDSGGRVALNSGRDLTLAGAQVSGNRVTAEAGRNLTLSSQQYSDNYDSGQTSFGAGGSYGFGSMPVSGYVSLSRDKMRSRYNSVQEQSGIFAGDGGFDITTGNHTQLDGGVIASTAAADKNRLDTGTLGFSDIGNKADFSVSHSGVSAGLSSGASLGKQLLANGMANAAGTVLAGLGGSGHAEGTTVAGKAFVATAADAKAYNKALSYLKMYGVQSGQAAVGTDALMVLPGVPGALVCGTVAAGGAYQTGTGVGQIADGNYGDGILNIGLGTAAIFGSVAGQGAVSKPGGGIISQGDTRFWQNSTIGNNIVKSDGTLTGRPTPVDPKMTKENIRSLNRENESAQTLSHSGFHVEQNPSVAGNKNPDYRINGEIFDNYAPKSNSVRNIYSEVKSKIDKGQTSNVVINMSDTNVSVPELQKQLTKWPIMGLDKVIVVDKAGNAIRVK